MSKLTAKQRDKLKTKSFAAPGARKLPIENAGHVRAAMARFNQTDFASSTERRAAYRAILRKAKELGIDSSGFEAKHG